MYSNHPEVDRFLPQDDFLYIYIYIIGIILIRAFM